MMMPKGLLAFMCAVAILMVPSQAPANTSSVTTWVHIDVEERNEISILTHQLSIDEAIDGNAGRYPFLYKLAVTGNRFRKIMAHLKYPLPETVIMSMKIPAPGKGTSEGEKTLSTKPVVLVSGLSNLGEKEGQGILIFKTDITAPSDKGMGQIILTLEYE